MPSKDQEKKCTCPVDNHLFEKGHREGCPILPLSPQYEEWIAKLKNLLDFSEEDQEEAIITFISQLLQEEKEKTIREMRELIPLYLAGAVDSGETSKERQARNNILRETRNRFETYAKTHGIDLQEPNK